jgi:riboflavin synthase
MFTGIIQAVGKIHEYEARGNDARMVIAAGALDLSDVAVGDSIAVNGVCLTAVALTPATFTVDVSAETLRCTEGFSFRAENDLGTEGFAPGAEVNLEKAMRPIDRLGGHIVSGHVDGVGSVARFEPVGESHLLAVDAPAELARYIAAKGSITVQGVSLTVNRVEDVRFFINLIPHTLAMTTLKHLKPGSRVNLEIDMVARYVERLTQFMNPLDKD